VKQIESQMKDSRFRMFFAVHEIEAWILSQPSVLPSYVQCNLPRKIENPETINFIKPPGKLLDNLYHRGAHKGYKKRVHGSVLLEELDPEVAAEKCPYLRKMLDEMLKMAHRAGL